MKLMSLTALPLLVSGCGIVLSDSAICDGTADLRTQHAAALVVDGGPQSVKTGAQLIETIDAGCAE